MKGAYVINLEPYEIRDFTMNISCNWECVELLIRCVRFYLIHSSARLTKVSTENKPLIHSPHIKIEIIPTPRLYIYVSSNKYISIVFPFNVKLDGDNITLWYNDVMVDEKIISEIITLLHMRQNSRSSVGASKNTLLELYVSNDEYEPISDNAFYVTENLLQSEYGYIRHDYDPHSANGKIHPEYHMDINYSKYATFKYGAERMLSNVEFEFTFDKNKECLYLRE